MKIHLKQREIEAALRGYIAKQGISLQGRTLEIDFTSGRSGNGLTADISIEEIEIPGFESSAQDEPAGATDDGAGDEQASQETEIKPTPGKTTKPTLKAVPMERDDWLDRGEAAAPAVVDPSEPTPPVSEPPTTVKTGKSLFN